MSLVGVFVARFWFDLLMRDFGGRFWLCEFGEVFWLSEFGGGVWLREFGGGLGFTSLVRDFGCMIFVWHFG